MGTIRIIGGKWRGRRLQVADISGLRPTPDRVRETLFNWIGAYLPGARCLDVFAGSGALGFEASSRGAAYVEMVDEMPKIIMALKEANDQLGGDIHIYQAKAPQGLHVPMRPYDIVFLDPPYQDELVLIETCVFLEQQGFLAEEAYVYLEARKPIEEDQLPAHWQLIKAKRAGEVAYHLVKRTIA